MTEPDPSRRAAPSPVDRLLSLFSDVRAGESAMVLSLLLSIFLVLVAYYVLKTVREPLILASAAQDMRILQSSDWPQWLKDVLRAQHGPQLKAIAAACQALLLIGFVPFYGWIASKVGRVKLIVSVTVFFILDIELFYLAMLAGVPFLGFVFFVWVGIFSVAIIAQFWSFANDIYETKDGERLFPIVALGATAGSPVGSILADRLFTLHMPTALLIQVPALVLGLYLVMTVLVSRTQAGHGPRALASAGGEPAVGGEPSVEQARLTGKGGFALVLRSPYIRLVALLIVLLNTVNTSGEFILSEYVVGAAHRAAAADPSVDIGDWIGSWYGGFFFWVNVIGLGLQALVVSRLVKYLGMRGVLFVLPVVALGAYALIGAGVGLVLLRWAKTAENATDYSVMNTGKALLWLPTSRDEKYKAKQAVDTFFVRMGDVFAAVLFLVGTLALHLQMHALGLVNAALVLLWLVVTFAVVRRHWALGATAPVPG